MDTKDAKQLPRIVAELSTLWLPDKPATTLLSTKFERAIEVNRQRGYALESWQMTQSVYNGQITETIIAVFKRESEASQQPAQSPRA